MPREPEQYCEQGLTASRPNVQLLKPHSIPVRYKPEFREKWRLPYPHCLSRLQLVQQPATVLLHPEVRRQPWLLNG